MNSYVSVAGERIRSAELEHRVKVHLGDYHTLAFGPGCFDRVLFLESLGYAYDLRRVLSESSRVLVPNGTLYIKDVFRDEQRATTERLEELSQFNDIYRYRTRSVTAVARCLSATGFTEIDTKVFTGEVRTYAFTNAMIRQSPKTGEPVLTELGRHHYHPFQALPVVFAEILARRP